MSDRHDWRGFTLKEINESALCAGIASPNWTALEKQLAKELSAARADLASKDAEIGRLRAMIRILLHILSNNCDTETDTPFLTEAEMKDVKSAEALAERDSKGVTDGQ